MAEQPVFYLFLHSPSDKALFVCSTVPFGWITTHVF